MVPRLKIDISQALRVFANVLKKVSYATNNALTRTAKLAVPAAQDELTRDFTIRKNFIQTRIEILQYSTIRNLTVIVGVDANVQGGPLLLGFFEQGGLKLPTRGDAIAVPITGTPVRDNFNSSIRNALKYSNLDIVNNKGKSRTYVVPGVGIFERVKKGDSQDATILIYKFEPNAVLPRRTHLVQTMLAVFNDRFSQIWAEEFDKEVTKTRPK